MRGQPTISPIYRIGERDDAPDPLEQWGRIERMRRKAWRDHGVVSVRPSELPHDLALKIIEWAERSYGTRGRGGKP